ncbi:MAG: 4-hydroxythreonine-4-phosphate dehydrogenase PdxA [Bacteroidaceae bacterium]|nr:4-hydroxythreonine-4-phosphate dehydrogenase PdxA [Bacteroidaceae bacterium]
MERLKIGITQGNTNGVGYEVILKTFEDPTTLELCTPVIYGSPKVATYHRKAIGATTNFYTIQHAEEAQQEHLNVLECITEEVKIDLEQPTDEAQQAADHSRAAAEKDLKEGKIDALVYAPGDTLPANDGLTLLLGENMRVAVATNRMPLSDVARAITAENVTAKIKAFDSCLKRDFGLTRPRIAVLQLNPEAGKEEAEAIAPSLQNAEAERISAFGPFSSDQFFGGTDYRHYDGILAMHYEQGLTPMKMLCGYNIYLQAGCETVATAPLQDAQFSIAGQGVADITPFCNALYAAIDVCRSRVSYDEARQDPLPKLFHDKREDNRRPAANPE